ncbi:MAG TPA: hypothetical protein VH592_03535 [Gemmataceae bacterium]|jgi:hypothetical protein
MNLKRMPLVLSLVAVLVLASLGWLVALSRNSQAAPAPSSDAAFKGKVLLVNPNNIHMSAFLLEKVQVQKIGDHSFLIGKGVSDSQMGSWYKDRTVRLQMEHVVSITEFDDLKAARKAMESGGETMLYLAHPPTPIPTEPPPAGAAPVPPPPIDHPVTPKP